MSRDFGDHSSATGSVLDGLEVQDVLSGAFYTPAPVETEVPRAKTISTPRKRKAKAKPKHYKVICVSMYNPDIANLDAMVKELKARGVTKANRSALIRHALSLVDLDNVPRGM